MTEEIKKILEYLKNDNYETEAPNNIEVSNYDLFKMINSVDNDKLLNYITNLQKENEELKEELQKADSITQSCIFEGSRSAGKSYRQCLNWLEDYKSRNEKAIEYIKKDTRWFDSEYAKIYGTLCDCEGTKGDRLEVLVNPTNLLNILQGGDE